MCLARGSVSGTFEEQQGDLCCWSKVIHEENRRKRARGGAPGSDHHRPLVVTRILSFTLSETVNCRRVLSRGGTCSDMF